MAALDDDEAGTGRGNGASGLASVFVGEDRTPGENFGLRDVWGHNQCDRQQKPRQGGDGLWLKEAGAAFGDHDWIDHQVRYSPGFEAIRDVLDDDRVGEHAGLGGVGADVLQDDIELRDHDLFGHLGNGEDTPGALGGDRGKN